MPKKQVREDVDQLKTTETENASPDQTSPALGIAYIQAARAAEANKAPQSKAQEEDFSDLLNAIDGNALDRLSHKIIDEYLEQEYDKKYKLLNDEHDEYRKAVQAQLHPFLNYLKEQKTALQVQKSEASNPEDENLVSQMEDAIIKKAAMDAIRNHMAQDYSQKSELLSAEYEKIRTALRDQISPLITHLKQLKNAPAATAL